MTEEYEYDLKYDLVKLTAIMKKFFVLLTAALACLTVFSCEKYEDGRPARSVIKEFNRMYPDAKDVEWEPERGYWKVSFETGSLPDRVDHEAWYDASGIWLRTETDVRLSSVPQKILDYLRDSEYGTSSVERDDVEYVETPEGDYYRFEIRYGGVSVYVNVSDDGTVTSGGLDW